jgi:activator of HSP90 ATPase
MPVKELVRDKITPQIREHLHKLGPALIEAHKKDLQHAPGSNPSSGFSTPRYTESSSINKSSSTSKPTSSASESTSKGYTVNVTTVTDESEFRTTAAELYTTFTDPQRITAFTRSAPLVFEGAKPGGKFELFGGNVSGEYAELKEPTLIVQKWRLAQWPAGHYSTLKIQFQQNDVDAVTVMRVDWEGVPVGQEEVTKRNWGEYYVRSIKLTFGFGTVL